MTLQTLLLLSSLSFVTPQIINPDTVPIGIRDGWCTTQQASCPLLCTQIGGTDIPTSNTCEPSNLDYSCVCSNGMQPNASQYSQTIPYFECTEAANQCVAACANDDSNCATNCRTSTPCGAQNPIRVNLSTVTTSMMSATAMATGAAATGSGAAANTGFGGPGAPAATGTSAGSMLQLPPFFRSGEIAGFGAMLVAFLAGFAILI